MRVEDVFVVGGQPTVTYYERDSVAYEGKIERYLLGPQQVLSKRRGGRRRIAEIAAEQGGAPDPDLADPARGWSPCGAPSRPR